MARPLACALAGALALPAAAQVYVPGDFPDLQAAIDGSAPGTVILAAGSSPPIVVDKPLTILGNPTWGVHVYCGSPATAITLQGPGSGRVVFGSFATSFDNCSPLGTAIAGSGFDELHLLDATIPVFDDHLLDGQMKGQHAIDVNVPAVLISACAIEATSSDSALCGHPGYGGWAGTIPQGPPSAGVHAPNSQVLVLDSTIVGGETNNFCCIQCDCITLPDDSLEGAGGPGVVADTLFVSNSEIRGAREHGCVPTRPAIPKTRTASRSSAGSNRTART